MWGESSDSWLAFFPPSPPAFDRRLVYWKVVSSYSSATASGFHGIPRFHLLYFNFAKNRADHALPDSGVNKLFFLGNLGFAPPRRYYYKRVSENQPAEPDNPFQRGPATLLDTANPEISRALRTFFNDSPKVAYLHSAFRNPHSAFARPHAHP